MRLHIKYLGSLEDSDRVRNACIKYLQRWLISFYPERSDLVTQLMKLTTDLGGKLELASLPWKYAWIQKIFGWTAAKKSQLTYNKYESIDQDMVGLNCALDFGLSATDSARILYISQHWPHRQKSASELRAFYVRRALEKIGQVDVVVLDAEGGGEDWAPNSGFRFRILESLAVQERPNRSLYQKLMWALDPRTPYFQGIAVGSDAATWMQRQIDNYDLIWFSKIRTPGMFPQWTWPRSVLDIDDVPSLFEASVFRNQRSLRERALTRIRYTSLQRREKLLGERFSTLVVCSENDRRYLIDLGIHAPIHVVPNGFEAGSKEPRPLPTLPPRIGLAAIFDYYPNVEGIEWFTKECWPRIKTEVPDARLRLAGRYSSGPLGLSGTDIDWLGWVEDIGTEIDTWSLMIVPIRVGAGTRVKVALGFSRMCPIVSTRLGAYGYEARNEEEILLADSAEAFADACVRLIRKPSEAAEMAKRAREKFLQKWTWEAIEPSIWEAAKDCLRRGAGNSQTEKPLV